MFQAFRRIRSFGVTCGLVAAANQGAVVTTTALQALDGEPMLARNQGHDHQPALR